MPRTTKNVVNCCCDIACNYFIREVSLATELEERGGLRAKLRLSNTQYCMVGMVLISLDQIPERPGEAGLYITLEAY